MLVSGEDGLRALTTAIAITERVRGAEPRRARQAGGRGMSRLGASRSRVAAVQLELQLGSARPTSSAPSAWCARRTRRARR